MNDQEIETLLRKAPATRVPPDLQQRLQADIELPTNRRQDAVDTRLTEQHWVRRWLPSLGLALWILGCFVVLALQESRIQQLRSEQVLRAEQNPAVNLPEEANPSPAALLNGELERLRKDAADAERLRVEVSRLRESLAAVPALQAANEQLRQELKPQIAPPPNAEDDLFASRTRAQQIMCVNHLKQVGLAARIWANKNGNILPSTVESIVGELGSGASREKQTFCPEDGTTRYELMSPGVDEREPQVVYVRCPIHNNVTMVDGSVQQLGKRQVIQQNGKWILDSPAR